MSGRKGLGVKADDLISRLETDAFDEVKNAIRICPKKRCVRQRTQLQPAR